MLSIGDQREEKEGEQTKALGEQEQLAHIGPQGNGWAIEAHPEVWACSTRQANSLAGKARGDEIGGKELLSIDAPLPSLGWAQNCSAVCHRPPTARGDSPLAQAVEAGAS